MHCKGADNSKMCSAASSAARKQWPAVHVLQGHALNTGKEPLKGAIYAEDCRSNLWVPSHCQILLRLQSFRLLLISLNLHMDFWHCRLAFFLHECRLALVASWWWKQGELWHPERPLLIHLKDLVSHICTQPCLQSQCL